MTKYSFQDKCNVVAMYNNYESIHKISKITGISYGYIYRWIEQYKKNGIDGLVVKHSRKTYTIEFKKHVIDYYLNNSESIDQVAAHFKLSSSQVYSWNKLFKNYGLLGLKPAPKGRPSKVNSKKTNKKPTNKLRLTEKEKYEEEILKLKSKLHDYELKYDILKTIAQMEKDGLIEKRRK